MCQKLKKKQAIIDRKKTLLNKIQLFLKNKPKKMMRYELTAQLREQLRTARGARSAVSILQRRWLGLTEVAEESLVPLQGGGGGGGGGGGAAAAARHRHEEQHYHEGGDEEDQEDEGGEHHAAPAKKKGGKKPRFSTSE